MFTPASDGPCWIFIPASVNENQNSLPSDTLHFIYDGTNPTLTFSPPINPILKTSPIPLEIHSSELVSGLSVEDLFISNGTVENFSDEKFSLVFDGDDDFVSTEITYHEFFQADRIEIETRFRWFSEDSDGGTTSQCILGNIESGNSQFQLGIDIDYPGGDKKLVMVWADMSTLDESLMQYSIFDYTVIEFNEWYDIKVLLQNNEAKWFLDDALVETDEVLFTSIGRESSEVPELSIGRGNLLYDTYFHGEISNLSISSDELIAHWNFSDGEDNTLTDISNGSNHGTIIGAVWNQDSGSINYTDKYSFDILPIGDGPINLSIESNVVVDLAGNTNQVGDNVSIMYNGIAPGTPNNFAIQNLDSQLLLSWNQNTEGDLKNYRIYESDQSENEVLSLIDSTVNTNIQMSNLSNFYPYRYAISAVDTANNESPISLRVNGVPYNNSNNHSLSFDGSNDHAQITGLDDMNLDDITLSAWVNVSSLNFAGGGDAHLISKWHNATGKSFALAIQQSSAKAYFVIRSSGGGNIFTYTQSALDFDTWYHLTAMKDGNKIKIYLDGVLQEERTISNAINSSSTGVGIGSSYTGTSGFFHGFIDEVQIWERAISLDKINEIILGPSLSNSQEDMICYLRMERNSGLELYDLSGNDHYGTASDVSQWSSNAIQFLPSVLLSTSKTITNDQEVQVQVSFSTEVTGFSTDDIFLGNSNLVSFSGSGQYYELILSPLADGLVSIYIPEGVVSDQDGEFNTSSDTLSFTYDGTPPTATISSNEQALTKANPIPFTINFSENVNAFSSEDIYASDGQVLNFSNNQRSLLFDGVDDYLTVEEPVINDSKFSIMLNVKTTKDGTQPLWIGSNNISSTPSDYALYFDISGDGIFYTVISHGGVSSNLWSYDVNLADGQWHNIVFTFDNGLHRHYVDGNLTAEETFQYSTMNVTNLTQTLIGIGMWNARFYEGLIDDYAVWDIALDSNQIDEIIENGINSNPRGT